ncbi:MAG TPA: hypothetical protein VFN55_13130 [Solirubrobacteraceae bacterium]|nr:hypothetical protein [Solirubrobacteraceae bacterium]
MTGRIRSRQCAALVLAALGLGASPALEAQAIAAPAISAPAAPQNPHLAPNPNSNIHDDTWMTDAYRRPGPRRGRFITRLGALPASLCGSLTFDRGGRIVTVCPSTVSPPALRVIDPHSLRVIGQYTMPAGLPAPKGTPAFQNFTGGGYLFLDERDRIWTATKSNHLFVIAESDGGRRLRKVADYNLASVVTGQDRITSALPDFAGRIWFVTKRDGKVGVLDPRTRAVHVLRTGEEIENSFAVGRDAVYVVTNRRMYRFSADRRGRPRVDWAIRYRNSGIHKPSQVDAGSGATPTILPGGLVAITDNADPMDVVVMHTDNRLRRHEPRIACSVPVFARGASATENSLIGSGRSLIVENNYGYQDPFGPAAGTITTPGFARVDVNPQGTGCRLEWTNRTVRAPSVVPKLSTATQLIYTYAQNPNPLGGQMWSWVAISARTGRTAFSVPAGSGLEANNNYAGLAIGPGATLYLGTIGGIRTLRNAP